jgi:DNA replication initiation complex subunit (GINS family)
MPPSSLMDDERKFFDQLVNILKGFGNEMNEKFRSFTETAENKIEEAKRSIEELKPVEIETPMEKTFIKPNGKLLVKILTDLPRFIGNDMEPYGPLKSGDVLSVPEETGKLLITRKVAENILE